MTIYEIVNFNRELLKRLHQCGIRIDDVNYVDLYADYRKMVNTGYKIIYIAATLSSKYGICERKFYEIIKRFKTDCTKDATE